MKIILQGLQLFFFSAADDQSADLTFSPFPPTSPQSSSESPLFSLQQIPAIEVLLLIQFRV